MARMKMVENSRTKKSTITTVRMATATRRNSLGFECYEEYAFGKLKEKERRKSDFDL